MKRRHVIRAAETNFDPAGAIAPGASPTRKARQPGLRRARGRGRSQGCTEREWPARYGGKFHSGFPFRAGNRVRHPRGAPVPPGTVCSSENSSLRASAVTSISPRCDSSQSGVIPRGRFSVETINSAMPSAPSSRATSSNDSRAAATPPGDALRDTPAHGPGRCPAHPSAAPGPCGPFVPANNSRTEKTPPS